MEISTSILNVKEEECIKTFYNIETAGTDYFHIDVMDGKFVKNNTIEQMTKYCEYLKNITTIPLDVHLMVEDTKNYIKSFSIFEPRNITIHYEAVKNEEELMELIKLIRENNCKIGISIKPETKTEEIYKFLPYIHTVLVMTVEPGEGGQELIETTIEKIKKLKQYIDEHKLEIDLEADGGINTKNIKRISEAGCNIVVAGKCIIEAENMKETIKKLKNND